MEFDPLLALGELVLRAHEDYLHLCEDEHDSESEGSDSPQLCTYIKNFELGTSTLSSMDVDVQTSNHLRSTFFFGKRNTRNIYSTISFTVNMINVWSCDEYI